MGFENFPYTNFHELNLDWIAKIAKDFLEQYTHIQELIANGEQELNDKTTEGLAQLQTKATELEALLQAWYNTHSDDISAQLATAIQNFNTAADQKAEQTIASIPDDYTELSNKVGVKSYLPRPTDLDTITSRGVYNLFNQTVTDGYTNAPTTFIPGLGAILFVDTGGEAGVMWQVFIDTVGNISTRRRVYNVWETWHNGFYPANYLITNSFADGLDSGIFKSYNGFSRTDYIPCGGYDSLYFDGCTTFDQNFCCFYDSTKAFISAFTQRSKHGGNISIPKNAAFVVISGETALMQTAANSFRLLRARKDVNGGNWIFIGDSYLDGYTPDGSVESWGVKLANLMGLDPDKYVIASRGGTGFYARSEGLNFQNLLENVTAFEKNSVTNIVVCGGYNDNTYTGETIYNASVAFVEKAKELYPSALVSIGMIGYNSVSPGIRNNLRYNALYAYQQTGGVGTNARYLSFVEYALNNTLMSSDGIHPNANGQTQIAIAVKNALMGTPGLYYYKRLPQTDIITGTTSANGEIEITSTIASQNVLSVRDTSGTGFTLYRNDGYAVCFDNSMQPKANTNVSIEVTYM